MSQLIVVCQRSGVKFEASSKRVKQHPQVSTWLQQAHKEGWYGFCVEAIAQGKDLGFKEISEFEELVQAAKQAGLSKIANQQKEWVDKLAAIKAAKKERAEVKALLWEHGYRWHKSDVLDIAQGETGEVEWNLFHGDRFVGVGRQGVAIALQEIKNSK